VKGTMSEGMTTGLAGILTVKVSIAILKVQPWYAPPAKKGIIRLNMKYENWLWQQ